MGKKHKHEEHEEHENHERWLVSYADMITLLFVLFVVLFAMSQVDQTKFEALKSGLSEGFGVTNSIMTGRDSILDSAGISTVAEVAPEKEEESPGEIRPEMVSEDLESQLQSALAAIRKQRYAEAQAEAERLTDAYRRLQAALAKHGLQDDVQATFDDRGLVVSLVSRHVVFANDVATLTPRGRQIVDTLAPALAEMPDKLSIDGHTNQVKVAPKYYRTDWDLSSARAVTVLRRLQVVHDIPARRLAVAAYGHTRPLVPVKVAGSQEVNKRVDIVILSGLSAESRALLKEVGTAELNADRSSTTS